MLFHVGIEMEPFRREDDDDFLHDIICEGENVKNDGSHYLNDTGEGDAAKSDQMAAQHDTTEASIEICDYIYVQLHEFGLYICSKCIKWKFL